MQSGQFLVGDPDSLTQQILEQRAVTGAGVLVIRPEMGDMPLDDVAAGLELFSHEVLPAVHAA
jgi:alkanesulfonate monooxygenase SsuD/methylene tetrahydromethanopterin reductase-like flavin-dependent oxidoreductase (luciferase family)